MSYLEKNLEALRTVSPHQAAKLVDTLVTTPLSVSLKCQHGVVTWESSGEHGNFPESSSGLETLSAEQHLVILYGIGDGSYLEKIRQRKDVYFILVYEPSLTLFRDLLTLKDLTALISDRKITFFLGTDKRFYLKEIDNYFVADPLHYYFSGYFANLATPGIQRLPHYQPYILEFAEHFKKAIHNHTATLRSEPPEDAFRGFMNTIKNLPHLAALPRLGDFKNTFRGLPGIVVGSGPSLELSIPYLREIQNHAIIFSCDSTLKLLLSQGITPHFVGVLERSILQADLFEGISQWPLLVVPTMVHPKMFATHKGDKIILNRNIGFDQWLFPEQERFYQGNCIGHLALSSLAVLGCSEIFLVGLDSAYAPTQPGQTPEVYGKNATAFMKELGANVTATSTVNKQNFEIPGYDGKPRLTHYYWHLFSELYGEVLDSFKITNAKNVMPKEYGIPIPRTQRVDPEILLSLQKTSVIGTFTDFKEQIKKTPAPLDHTQSKIRDSRHHLQQVRKHCFKSSQSLSEFFADHDLWLKKNLPAYQPFFRRIEFERHKIMTEYGDCFTQILWPFVMNSHALMEHGLRKAYTTTVEPEKIIEAQTGLYMHWFHDVALWAERVLFYLDECGYHDK